MSNQSSFPEFLLAKILGESFSARGKVALESLGDSGNDEGRPT